MNPRDIAGERKKKKKNKLKEMTATKSVSVGWHINVYNDQASVLLR